MRLNILEVCRLFISTDSFNNRITKITFDHLKQTATIEKEALKKFSPLMTVGTLTKISLFLKKDFN